MKTYVENIGHDIYRLETQIPGENTIFSVYFIKGENSVLIEPGPAAIIPAIQNFIKEQSIGNLEYIIPTHIHLDHGGGLGNLIRLFPKAKAVVNPEAVKHVTDPSRLIRSTKMAFGDDFENIYGKIIPVPYTRLKVVQDNESLYIGDRQLVIIHSPGHAPHHIAIYDTKTKGLFCGEALGLIYSPGAPPLPAVAPPSFDPDVYVDNMLRLKELHPDLLFYSHGGVGREPEKLISTVIENTKIIGNAIYDATKLQLTDEAIIRKMGNFIIDRFGFKLDDYELGSNVRAYLHYFKRKNIIT
jgi:glyoxylase-like metal-dependent hydrolase (beta-lactamase superfamily II)